MVKKADKKQAREARHRRVREKISGTPERPRLNVFRSTKHIYAQVIDDVNGVTLASASNAIIIGFNVRPTPKAKLLADSRLIAPNFSLAVNKNMENIKFLLGFI